MPKDLAEDYMHFLTQEIDYISGTKESVGSSVVELFDKKKKYLYPFEMFRLSSRGLRPDSYYSSCVLHTFKDIESKNFSTKDLEQELENINLGKRIFDIQAYFGIDYTDMQRHLWHLLLKDKIFSRATNNNDLQYYEFYKGRSKNYQEYYLELKEKLLQKGFFDLDKKGKKHPCDLFF